MLKLTRSPLMRYVLPVGLVAAALALKLLLAPFIDGESLLLLFFLAVAASAWRGGLGPGLLATALAAFSAAYFFRTSILAGQAAGPAQNFRLLSFVVECVLLNALLGVRRAHRATVETNGKGTAALLEEAVSLLTSTLEATADGILVVDNHRKIVSFNKKFVKLWRLPAEIVERKNDEQALSFVLDQLRDPQEFAGTVERLYAEPLATSFDVIEFKDGRIFERHSQPQMLGETPIGRVWSFRDVTERRRAEESLRASEERYRQMFEKNRATKLLIDPESGQIVDANPSACLFYGYSREEFQAKNIKEINTLSAEEVEAEMSRAATEQRMYFVFRHRLASGEERDVEVYSSPLEVSGRTILYSIINDITERCEAERAVRRNEQLFRTLVENAEDLITVFNRDWTIRYESPAVEKMLGFKPSELRGRHLLEVVHPDDRKAMLREMRYKIEHPGEVIKVQGRIRHKDGTYRILEGRSVNLLRHPAVEGIVANTRDVTVGMSAQAELREKEEQLRQAQKMEAVGQLAGGIAHDFNNLLTAILGYSELLLKNFPEGAPQRRHVIEIKSAGERATVLIRQLLAFSRRQLLQPKVLSLNAVIAELENLLRRLLGEQLVLQLKLDPAAGPIKADLRQIEQVIINLSVNARDAMPEGGTLVIETRNFTMDENYAARHAGVRPGPYVMLAVSDTGTGIEPHLRERIFEPFFTTKEPGKGTGLGLSTTYGIVKQSEGEVWVYSEVGVGTTFKVYLPRVEEMEPPAANKLLSALPRGEETILLVEDEDTVRDLTREMLELLGYRVLAAADGHDALEIAGRHTGPLELLLTDVVMPHLGGRELAQRLRAARPDIRTLFMSGYTEDAIVQHGVLDPDIAFLHKPFTLEALARKLREALDDA